MLLYKHMNLPQEKEEKRKTAERSAVFENYALIFRTCPVTPAGGISALLIRSTTSAPLCSMLSMLFDSIAVETLCATFACAILTDILAM